jgi:hypothetical protein
VGPNIFLEVGEIARLRLEGKAGYRRIARDRDGGETDVRDVQIGSAGAVGEEIHEELVLDGTPGPGLGISFQDGMVVDRADDPSAIARRTDIVRPCESSQSPLDDERSGLPSHDCDQGTGTHADHQAKKCAPAWTSDQNLASAGVFFR